ncbi:mitochondrial carrier [Papiliotrema laurentii]|uniref:Mitochondrial carrier n=1 Tax=Papiliotrema laurentii TaxID=5418 RepID=A0AAD9CU74_PAPLA|nr:mitochondrial carrier [Papiliotrema laurentii]
MAPTQNKQYPFWLGGAAASMAACCTHPLDYMRVRMQTSTAKVGFTSSVSAVVREGGFRALYTGLSASIFRQMTYSVVRLGAYDALKQTLSKQGKKKLGMGEMLVCASGAGALGGLAGNPADVILVRMITDPVKPPEQRVHYRNAAHGVYKLSTTDGPAALFRGLLPNTIRAVIMNSGQLVSYDVFKSILLGTIGLTDGMPVHMLSSALAGTVATTISAPADVVRSRVMNMAKGNEQSVVGMITESLRKEGPRFLFKGWLPAWIRLTPNTIFMFVFLEQLRGVVDFVRAKRDLQPGKLA